MSWQAAAWTVEQETGSPHAKLILLLLANRANENGVCWPSQMNLAEQSEQSADTVQRHLKNLEKGGFIRRVRSLRTRGRWPGFIYQLLMPGVVIDGDELQKRPARKRGQRAALAANTVAPDQPPLADMGVDRLKQGGGQGVVNSTEPLPAARTEPLPAASPSRSQRFHRAAGSGVESSFETSQQTSPSSEPIMSSLQSSPVATAAAARRTKGLSEGRKQTGEDRVQDRIARRLGADGWDILAAMNPDQVRQIVGLERLGHLDDRELDNIRCETKLLRGANATLSTRVEVASPELAALIQSKASR
jgi:SOS-response transcriptional repressor LexA